MFTFWVYLIPKVVCFVLMTINDSILHVNAVADNTISLIPTQLCTLEYTPKPFVGLIYSIVKNMCPKRSWFLIQPV